MQLDEAQQKKVAQWIGEGQTLSAIQNRLASELGLRLTYMEVRMLVADLKLTPKDAEKPKAAASALTQPAAPTATGPGSAGTKQPPAAAPEPPATSAPTGTVSVTVDQLARPGTLVSGKVTFSDGNKADWYLDQTGRLGLAAQPAGYRPSQADLQQFQMQLETELSKLGF